jgi:hypothetical protein
VSADQAGINGSHGLPGEVEWHDIREEWGFDDVGVVIDRAQRLAIQTYGGVVAADLCESTPTTDPSLATCEQLDPSYAVGRLPNSELGEDTPTGELQRDALAMAMQMGVEDPDRAAYLAQVSPDSFDILSELGGTTDDRREKILQLLEQGDPSQAKRMALCGEQSVQLECPDEWGAGGCGHEDNYVPITCDSRLCDDCMSGRMGRLVEQYREAVQGWDNPTFITATVENAEAVTGAELADAVDDLRDDFNYWRKRTIPKQGKTVRDGSVKRWAWNAFNQEEPADPWRQQLRRNSNIELINRIEEEYINYEYKDITGLNVGREIPLEELLHGGFYAIDVKQVGDCEFNIHIHALVDMNYVPQAALAAEWEKVTGGDPVIDVRRIYGRGESSENAVAEVVGYATKPPEFDDTEMQVEYVLETKGRRYVQPFGYLHQNVPDQTGRLECANCEETPNWWTYRGLVREPHDNMGKSWETGDKPPPD